MKRWLPLLVAAAAGLGAASAAGGCGDDERGSVTVEDGSTSTSTTSTSTTGTTGTTETTP